MATPDDPGLITQVIDKAWIVIGALLGLIWRDHNQKINDAHKKLDAKADADDVKTALKHIEKLFDNAEADRDKTRTRFDQTMQHMSNMRREIIDEVRQRNGS